MPTNQQPDEKELSRLLSQAEPPRSPQHVDEAVLRYARENAPDIERQASSSFWFINRRWIPVLATFSIAALAVSVSLPIFSPSELEQDAVATVSEAEFGLRQESVVLQAQAPVDEMAGVFEATGPVEDDAVAVESRLARERADTNLALNDQPVQDVDQLEVAARSTTATALEEEVQLTAAAQPAAAPIAARDQAVAVPVAGQSTLRIDPATAAVAAISEENLLNFLALLGQVLDGSPTEEESLVVSGDSTPQALVARMVTLYGELVDDGALAAAEARYVTVTAALFTDFELPVTLEAAVNLLRPLVN